MATTWLITREADDAQAEREARGVDSIVVPCVETKLLPWPYQPGESGRTLTFFTSRRSIAAWVAAGKPALEAVAALKPATSTMLEAEGITPLITSEGGVVSLAEKVLAWAPSTSLGMNGEGLTIRYPTSDLGLKSPEQARALELLQKAGTVDRRAVYEITAPSNLRDSLERSARGEWAISFASPSAVQHFFGSGAVLEQAPVRVACLGAATERAWNSARPAGWPQAVNTREAPTHPEAQS